MSISFACPECRVQIEVADEHAGESGQCPRCQRVIVIPSPKKPMPILTAAETVPPADPWAPPRESGKSKRRPVDADEARPRRPRATQEPNEPMGPIWPWVVGVFGAVLVASLLLSSLLVLVLWRRAEPTRPPQVVEFKPAPQPIINAKAVTVGRLEGNRAVMHNGAFQVRTELTNNDMRDPVINDNQVFRCKRFEIELRRDLAYMLEQDSNDFDSYIRIENLQGAQWFIGDRNIRNCAMHFNPPQTGTYIVYASSVDPALGHFTLTIRERNVPKPFVP